MSRIAMMGRIIRRWMIHMMSVGRRVIGISNGRRIGIVIIVVHDVMRGGTSIHSVRGDFLGGRLVILGRVLR